MRMNPKNIAALILISSLIASVSFFAGCSQKSSLTISGTIEAKKYNIVSETAGRVISVETAEGAAIESGDAVVKLDASLQELTVEQLEAVVRLKKARLDEYTEMKEKQDEAKSAGMVPGLDDTAATAGAGATGAVATGAVAAAASSAAAVTRHTIDAAQADLDQSEVMLEQARLILSKYTIKAPAKGTLLSIDVDTGDMVPSGSNIGTVVKLDELRVKMFIPQRYLYLIKTGQKVVLDAISLKDTQIGGEITYISGEAEFTPRNVETSEAKENTVYMIKIKILDNIDRLRPGMTVETVIDIPR